MSSEENRLNDYTVLISWEDGKGGTVEEVKGTSEQQVIDDIKIKREGVKDVVIMEPRKLTQFEKFKNRPLPNPHQWEG